MYAVVLTNAATPSDISCETPHPVPESPGPALSPMYAVSAHRPQSGNTPFPVMNHETGAAPIQDVATPQVNLLPTGIDPTSINDVKIFIIRVIVGCPSQDSQPLELRIGAARDFSASVLDVYVGFGAGNSLRETYEYMLIPPAPFMKDPIVKQLAKYIRRSHYMFRLHHGPNLLSHELFVSESTDQIEALVYKLVDRGTTDHAAWTEQSSPVSSTSTMPELPRPLPINKEYAEIFPQQSTYCQAVTSQSRTTLRDYKANCDGKCNARLKGRVYWICVSQLKLCRRHNIPTFSSVNVVTGLSIVC